MGNLNVLLETNSNFIVQKIDPLFKHIIQIELLSTITFEHDRLLSNIVSIICTFESYEVKCNYYMYLCELTDKLPVFTQSR